MPNGCKDGYDTPSPRQSLTLGCTHLQNHSKKYAICHMMLECARIGMVSTNVCSGVRVKGGKSFTDLEFGFRDGI